MDNEKLKKSIIKKSMELFSSMGVKVVTMDDISKELSVSKKTIYMVFSKKEDIIKESIDITLKTIYKEIEEVIYKKIHPIQELRELNDIYVYYLNDMVSPNMLQIQKYHADIYEYLENSIYKLFYDSFKNAIKKGIDENIYRVSTLDTDIYVIMYYNLMKSIVFNSKINRRIKKNILETQIFFFARGISSGKGFSIIDTEEKRFSYKRVV